MRTTRRDFLRQLGLGAAGAGLVSLAPGCRTRFWAGGAKGLPRSLPGRQGIDPQGILSFLDAAAERKIELHSLMVVRHGQVVAEGWWKPYGPDLVHTMYSMSKSFTSTAVGLAVAEGRLTVDDRVVKFFPDDLPAQVSENLAVLRVRDLLSMSVGSEKEPTRDMVQQENWVGSFLAAPITHRPGSVFMYNSAATYMCSALVQKLTGQRILDYLRPRLLTPLGIEQATWETCPRGINTGGWGLSVQTESLAKFGQLYLQKGQWNGRQILPAAWVEEATAKHIQQPQSNQPGRPTEQNDWQQGYGYQFWRSTHGAFRGDGAFGQFTVVLPEQDAVVVMTSESNNLQGQLDLVWQHLLPAMKSQTLVRDDAQARLERRLDGLCLATPEGNVGSPTQERIGGRTYQFEQNELGLQSVDFRFARDAQAWCIAFRDARAEHAIGPVCAETALPGTPPRLITGGAPPPGTKFRIATTGAWKDDNTFNAIVRYIETPHHDRITCRFEGDRVEIAFMNSIAAMGSKPQDKRPVLRGRMA